MTTVASSSGRVGQEGDARGEVARRSSCWSRRKTEAPPGGETNCRLIIPIGVGHPSEDKSWIISKFLFERPPRKLNYVKIGCAKWPSPVLLRGSQSLTRRQQTRPWSLPLSLWRHSGTGTAGVESRTGTDWPMWSADCAAGAPTASNWSPCWWSWRSPSASPPAEPPRSAPPESKQELAPFDMELMPLSTWRGWRKVRTRHGRDVLSQPLSVITHRKASCEKITVFRRRVYGDLIWSNANLPKYHA